MACLGSTIPVSRPRHERADSVRRRHLLSNVSILSQSFGFFAIWIAEHFAFRPDWSLLGMMSFGQSQLRAHLPSPKKMADPEGRPLCKNKIEIREPSGLNAYRAAHEAEGASSERKQQHCTGNQCGRLRNGDARQYKLLAGASGGITANVIKGANIVIA